MIKVVLFDMDGVLCDLAPLHYDCLNYALVAHGCAPISPEEHESEFDGLPTRVKLSTLSDRGRVKIGDINSIAAAKQILTRSRIDDYVKFDPTIYCLIAGLREAKYKVGIVSNAVSETITRVVYKLRISEFVCVRISNEYGKPKPAPDLYLAACSRFDVKPAEALVVEDGKYGIEAAKAAGCSVLEVSSPRDVTPENVWTAILQS